MRLYVSLAQSKRLEPLAAIGAYERLVRTVHHQVSLQQAFGEELFVAVRARVVFYVAVMQHVLFERVAAVKPSGKQMLSSRGKNGRGGN